MISFNRKDLEARYKLFKRFAFHDQANYYRKTARKYEKASIQVNRLSALASLATGLSAAFAGFIVQYYFAGGRECAEATTTKCETLDFLAHLLVVLAIVLPIVGAIFNNLADLYQWERLTAAYETASGNMHQAESHEPMEDMQNATRFAASYQAYIEGALAVMRDETAQWGQTIKPPVAIEEYVKQAQQRASDARVPPDLNDN